ncbi:MAG: sensor histidine kinase, partial [Planctomycetota bacterium]
PHLAPAAVHVAASGRSADLRLGMRAGHLHLHLHGPGPVPVTAGILAPVVGLVAVIAVLAAALLGAGWSRDLGRLVAAWRGMDPAGPDTPAPVLRRGAAEMRALDQAAVAAWQRMRRRLDSLQAAVQDQERVSALQRAFLRRTLGELLHPLLVIEQAAVDERLGPAAAAGRAVAERLVLLRGMDVELPGPEGVARSVDLPTFCAQLEELLQPVARRRGVCLGIASENGSCACDDRALAQVLVALLANACAAPGAAQVSCSLRLVADALHITVVDDGSGLPLALAERLQQACERGDIMPGEAGVGLGLPLVLAQLRCMDGRLQLVRSDADGTRLDLTIPVG